MRIDVVTIFPGFFDSPLHCSILGRAQSAGVVRIECHDLREYTDDPHRTVDDAPYGGGAGMVMKADPFFRARDDILGDEPAVVALMTPQGAPFTQATAQRLASVPRLMLLCGHYEGVDERVRQAVATEEISVGDYVLTGGELAALVVIDAVTRLLPGAIGNPDSPLEESHSDGLLEYPQYTRPAQYRGMDVPELLMDGSHAVIAAWRRKEVLRRALQRRPELLAAATLSRDDRRLLAEIWQELSGS